MTRDQNRAAARFNRASGTKPTTTERDVAAKAVLDNMARLKALRLAREAAEPPRPATVKNLAARPRSRAKRARRWRLGWRASKAADAGPEFPAPAPWRLRYR